MRISSQLLLTFLLNAFWQVALITALAACGSWLLKNSSARYQHWLWVTALCLAFAVPAITSSRTLVEGLNQTSSAIDGSFATEHALPFSNEAPQTLPTVSSWPSTFQLNQSLAFALLAIYCGFLIYRAFKLVRAWQATRAIKRLAVEVENDERVAVIIRRCERELGAHYVKVFRSETVPVPVTAGLFHPVIILP